MFALVTSLVVSASPLSMPYERYTLPNGLTVILHEDHALPTVVVNVWFNVGSANERVGRTGFAHLFEHLMFMGTRDVPNGQFDAIMEQVGGVNNASTSEDRTNYFETGPSNLLETFLWLEGDRLAHLPDDMTRAKVDLQRDVVKNERRQSFENQPYGMSTVIGLEQLFPPTHPYHHSVIGSHADLTAASVDDVKAFFRTHYVASNASLTIAGDFDSAEAKRLVEKYLGGLPRVEAPLAPVLPVVELQKPIRVVQPDAVQQERVELWWLAPAAHARGAAECQVLAAVLGGSKSSRLTKSIVVEQQLSENVEVSCEGMRGQGIFEIAATAQPGHTAAEVESAIDAELKKLLSSPPNAAEVGRAQATLMTHLLSALEAPAARADALNEAELTFGDPSEATRGIARLEAVNPSGVMEAVRRVLGRPRLTLTFVPKKAPKTVVKKGTP